ncbi:excinuclease ABC subunit UvrC [Colwellia sp. MB3u-28]|nr:excinuclease ABC subunit UvrC [Colwellia sp. MB02u-7]MBA6237259.1 excinuclease ABC subunit UvrC [Colwellia sp. MB02u-11]MBA6257254.1 excinuclease ABC subunit UvrC [Colwellia sp. MB3u-28]MBA6258839.1 excinuclease ABC subunit UvrC [Colwellia sp. MB3u-41]MBA6300503.1 excinuclease ABC subunit UvrC [Colwellia sp. MB3u-22]MBA6302840.1 excinuclease ABC subunit UvrC [Colwellia sp. MB02u-14]MBA6311094.1 excinuclease ABC subunit UvrC [Colwellia sp. MB3u-64]
MFDHQAFLSSVSEQAGVYRMYDKHQAVIYVGKAKQLKKRLSSYFRKDVGSTKTKVLVSHIIAIDVTVTHTEGEALILENNYIKKYLPKYNILLRDDKSYPYLLITDHKHPKLGVHRGGKKVKGEYFGPYPTVGAVWESLRLMQKLFPVRQCEDSYYRARSRPCLQYQLNRCSAPCVDKISAIDYQQQVDMAKLFLRGKSSTVITSLVSKMEEASQTLHFESAAKYRDQIATLRQVQKQQFVSGIVAELDVIGIYIEKSQVCVHVLFIRDQKILGSKSYFPSVPADTEPAEVYQAFISQHYLGQDLNSAVIPKEIVISESFEQIKELTQLLSEQAERNVKISTSVRSERAQYLKLACTNAQNALATKNSHKASMLARFLALNEVFELDNGINRIECFDISHTMGQQTVASNVVFNQEGPLKSDYRRYNVYGITPGDDYAAMAFALNKRYGKVTNMENMPDIVFIDGGKGQLSKAEEFFANLQANTTLDKIPLLVGVAKGEGRKPGLETLILAGSHQLISLPPTSSALHLVQHIRDESHRFAITGHRAKRQKASKKSTLESIEGIGAKKRQALLKYLGGLQEVMQADKSTLEKVPGISKVLAEAIYNALHEK